MEKQYVCLWNEEQKCEHVEELETYVEDSLNKVLQGKPQKWIIVFVGSSKNASRFATKINFERTNT